jgi:hypothetical protein
MDPFERLDMLAQGLNPDEGDPPSMLDLYMGQLGGPMSARKPFETPQDRARRLLAHARAGQQKARELEGEDPGFGGLAAATARDAIVGPFAGLAERAGIVDPGTRQSIRQDFEATRERYLQEDPNFLGRGAVAYLTEVAANAVPVVLGGGGVGSLATRGATRLGAGTAAARIAGGAAGGAFEGGLTGFGNSAGQSAAESAKATLLGAGLGAAAGGVGGAVAARRLAAQPGARPRDFLRSDVDANGFLGKYAREPKAQGGGLAGAAQRFYRDMLNDKNPIERLGKRGGRDIEDPVRRNLHALVQQVRAESELSAGPVFRHTRRVNAATGDVTITGESLKDVIRGHSSEVQDDLQAYLLALRHTEDLAARHAAGEPGLRINDEATADSAALVNRLTQKYGVESAPGAPAGRLKVLDELADRYRDWTKRAFLDPLEDAGVINAQQRANIEAKNQHYAIFSRSLDHLEKAGIDLEAGAGAAGKGSTPRQGSPVKRIHGGLDAKNPVGDLWTESAVQAMRVSRFAARQQVRNAVVDLAEQSPGLFPEIAKAPTKTRRVATVDDAPVFRSAQESRDTFSAWRDGEATAYHAAPDLLDALNSVGPRQLPWVFKPLQFLARMMRSGATLGPEFIVRNPVRDQVTAGIYSQHGYIPIWDAGRGLFHVLGRTKTWQEFMDSPAVMSSLVSLDKAAVRTDLRAASRVRSRGREAAQYLNPIRSLQAVSEFLERATRVGEFSLARQGGRRTIARLPVPGTLGRSGKPRASVLEAGLDAAEVTLNFSRAGGYGRMWNSLEAFANAELQDVDKFARTMRARPGTTLMRMFAYITVPSVLHAMKWKDDKDYAALPEWDRMLFYHLGRTKDGGFFRVPRPIGVMSVAAGFVPEQGIRYLHDQDPRALDEMEKAFTEQTPLHFIRETEDMMPLDLTPTGAEPLVEIFANRDPFRNRRIIPMGEERELPQSQGLDVVGETAILGGQIARSPAGRFLGLDRLTAGGSPLAVQHIIRGYGATLGRLAEDASDAAIRWAQGTQATPAPARTLADVPVVRAFVSREPIGFGSQPVTDFYRLADLAEKARNTLREDPPRNIPAFIAEHPEIHLAQPLQATRLELSELRKVRSAIRASDLTPTEKASRIHQIDMLVSQIAGLQMHATADILEAMRRPQSTPTGAP